MSGLLQNHIQDKALVRCGELPVPRLHSDHVIPAATHPLPGLIDAAVMRGLARRRFNIGDLLIELRYHARPASADFHPAASRAMLLIPLNSDVHLVECGDRYRCSAGTPFFYSREEALNALWRPSSWGLAIHLRRDRLNAAVSALLNDGRRLAPTARMLGAGVDGRGLEQSVERFIAALATAALQQGPAAISVESNFYRALASRIVELGAADEMMPPVRIVSDAMRLVRENHTEAFDNDRLATMVGVTAGTLRKGFRTCLGVTVKEYIQRVRLDWAHERLSSARESRSIASIAAAAGFADTANFSRSYVRRFGEPASQTRARAVHEMT